MTSKIKVDNINKVSDDSNIINKCGTTITLGASGDSINLAAGASQSGFGRSGSVNWQTTPKTTTFTAVDGEGYFVNSGSALTMNLPAGSAGAIVAVSDYARNFNTYNLTVSPNGSEKIGGVADDATLNVDGQAATFVYVDSTKGWINVQNAEDTEQGATFITASGGNQPTPTGCVVDTNYKIHYFTSPGTFCVSAGGGTAAIADYLVVAGGGGGGGTCSGNDSGGGGGGGGFRLANTTGMSTPQTSPLASCSGLPFSPGPYSVSVGGGGAGSSQPSSAKGTSGCASTVSSITSAGGGGGGFGSGPNRPGLDGGSGGGGGGSSATVACGGTGNTPVVSPAQGTDGGGGGGVPINYWGGGGGGAACAGGQGAPPNTGGPGGSGSFAVQTGFAGCNGTTGPVPGARYFAGGGAGGGTPTRPTTGGGTAGDGGGGGGRASDPAGGTNTGGGGGGGDNSGGRNGGSGIVFIRYKFQ
jgi:hypothetical protein